MDQDTPIATLVEWQAPGLTLEDARRVAADTQRLLSRQPGLLAARFFGDFQSGRHFYLLSWRDRSALESYARSEEMVSVRAIAAPFVEGKVTRDLFTDYTAD